MGRLTFYEALKREDRRVRIRREEMERARRKLLPVVVAVCEIYGVSPDDILSRSVHPDVVMARNIVIWLGYSRYKIGPGILSKILNKSRPELSKKIKRLGSLARAGGVFSEAVSAIAIRS